MAKKNVLKTDSDVIRTNFNVFIPMQDDYLIRLKFNLNNGLKVQIPLATIIVESLLL